MTPARTPHAAALDPPAPPPPATTLPAAPMPTDGHGAWTNELVRKLIHLGMVVLPAWIWWAPDPWRSPGLLLALAVVFTADVLRQVWTPWARWIEGWSRPYRRPRERRLWVGVHAMFLSAWLLSWSVSPQLAVLCSCYGVFGDAAAAVVGRWSARTRGKSAWGSLACFTVCFAVGLVVVPHDPTRIVLGSCAATFLERMAGPIDDNLTIPLGTAIVLSLLS